MSTLINLVARFYEADGHAFDLGAVEAALAPLLVDDTAGLVWIIESGERAAGYAVITWGHSLESGGREALLDEMFVSESDRGLGGAALAEILELCRLHGARRAFLETESPNVSARRFYARHGFVEDDSVWMSRWL